MCENSIEDEEKSKNENNSSPTSPPVPRPPSPSSLTSPSSPASSSNVFRVMKEEGRIGSVVGVQRVPPPLDVAQSDPTKPVETPVVYDVSKGLCVSSFCIVASLSLSPFPYLSIYLSTYLSLFLYLSIYLSIYLSLFLLCLFPFPLSSLYIVLTLSHHSLPPLSSLLSPL